MIEETDTKAARAELLQVAQSVVDGTAQPVEACRRMMELGLKLEIADSPEFDVIRGIESQTEVVPIGSLRDEYEKGYLERIDRDMGHFLSLAMPGLEAACRRLLERQLPVT